MNDNPYLNQKDGVIRFDLLKINHDARKLCTCKKPHYELDMKNRMVKCTDCGAIVDPFEALETFALQYDYYADYQKKLSEEINYLKQEAERQSRRRLKLQTFKDMERAYVQNDLLPCCPHCDKPFDPIYVRHSRNRKCGGWEVNLEGSV